jgi:hypothetical protein
VYVIKMRPRSEVHLGRASVIARHANVPQEVVQVCIIAVAEERLRVRCEDLAVDMRDDRDLIVTADRREHGPDTRICECRLDIGRSRLGARAELPSSRIFDRHKSGDLRETAHGLFVNGFRHGRRGKRGRQNRDPLAGLCFRGSGERAWCHPPIETDDEPRHVIEH